VKHIGQTMQTVLKHLVGIEGVKVPSESSNRRMILEIVALAIIGKIITTPFMKLVDSKTFATHIQLVIHKSRDS
jgi:hypothetical protein